MTINCNGKLIDLTTPKVMGILNLTPDSFYDGGKYGDIDAAISQVEVMLSDGATFIDVGAYSSRPGATDISVEEEERRLIPVVRQLVTTFPEIVISVDTFRASVAKKAIEAGAAIVNDISAGMLDDDMMAVLGALQVPYIMMHMRGTPQTMKQLTTYDNFLKEVMYYFSERVAVAESHKINDLIIDPGFGFAKTTAQSFELLNNLDLLKAFELPVLAGVSRKSMIYKTLDVTADNALNGTTVLNTVAISKGARILRVHDVKEAMELISLSNALSSHLS
ncbi:dihydropteroate synthase [Dokdonia donghaensis]|uniref:Dihydropteroate synthase n=1 Tax=Dokdonia donghaensis DSW-1 TaxID=1300343 RepID=A0A0A2GZG3_9FLAO|nr:dihydropteroate synthase [Dokdonia donghaensis]ANH60460.1 Dihydropteroate synthase [Dokdonia donghaensis DSW-1]KGO07726.1 dihydropteroate synthase [Dokdonia donghaensis DSW-1]